jgi:hypothetical protein
MLQDHASVLLKLIHLFPVAALWDKDGHYRPFQEWLSNVLKGTWFVKDRNGIGVGEALESMLLAVTLILNEVNSARPGGTCP